MLSKPNCQNNISFSLFFKKEEKKAWSKFGFIWTLTDDFVSILTGTMLKNQSIRFRNNHDKKGKIYTSELIAEIKKNISTNYHNKSFND